MKKQEKTENNWDPIVLKLLEKREKQELLDLVTIIDEPIISSKVVERRKEVIVLPVKRSEEEFKLYLRSLFANDPLKVKYQNPDLWLPRKKKKFDLP
jgi:hypothetical protein